MIKGWNGLKVTPIIDASTPPLRNRPGVYKAKEAGKPARTPMFWSYWNGLYWGPVVKNREDAMEAFWEECRAFKQSTARRCHYQGIAK